MRASSAMVTNLITGDHAVRFSVDRGCAPLDSGLPVHTGSASNPGGAKPARITPLIGRTAPLFSDRSHHKYARFDEAIRQQTV
jgi:hypothetical protein